MEQILSFLNALSRTLLNALSVGKKKGALVEYQIYPTIVKVTSLASILTPLNNDLRAAICALCQAYCSPSLGREAVDAALERAQACIQAAKSAFTYHEINIQNCISKLECFQLTVEVNGLKLSDDETLAVQECLKDAIALNKAVELMHQELEAIVALGESYISDNRHLGNLASSMNKDDHRARREFEHGNPAHDTDDEQDELGVEQEAPDSDASSSAGDDGCLDNDDNDTTADGAPEGVTQDAETTNQDGAGNDKPQSFHHGIEDAKNCIEVTLNYGANEDVQLLLELLKQYDLLGGQSSEQKLKEQLASIVTKNLHQMTAATNDQLRSDSELNAATKRFLDLTDAHASIDAIIARLQDKGVDWAKLAEVTSDVALKERLTQLAKAAAAKAKRKDKGKHSNRTKVRKPKDKGSYPVPVQYSTDANGITTATVTLPTAVTQDVLSNVIGLAKVWRYADNGEVPLLSQVKLTYEEHTDEHKVRSFDLKLTMALPENHPFMIWAKAIGPGSPPLGVEPCPGSSVPVGAIFIAMLMFLKHGIPLRAMANIMFNRPHGHSLIYDLAYKLDRVFFAPWANALRKLLPLAVFQMHDEFSLQVAAEAHKLVDSLKRKKIYFLQSLGKVFDDAGHTLFVICACTFMGGRGLGSLEPLLKLFLGEHPGDKVVHTDAYKLYRRLLKELGISRHQICWVHFIRTIIGALDPVFQELREYYADLSLSEAERSQKVKQLFTRDHTTKVLVRALYLSLSLFHLDPECTHEPSEDVEATLLKRQEVRQTICANIIEEIKSLITTLDIVEFKNGQYESTGNSRASSVATFFLNNEEELKCFLSCMLADKSTNPVERAVKGSCQYMKRLNCKVRTKEFIQLFTDFATIVATLEANDIDPYLGMCEMFSLAFESSALGYCYDRMVVTHFHDGNTTMSAQMRDARYDDPDTGVQTWIAEASKHQLMHGSLTGLKATVLAECSAKLTYPKRLAAMDANKEARKAEKAARKAKETATSTAISDIKVNKVAAA